MHRSQVSGSSLLLPKRLVDRVPLIESHDSNAPLMPGPNTWGLAGRIGALPGVIASVTFLPDGATATDFFVEDLYVSYDAHDGPQLLCHIDLDGILLPRPGAISTEVMHKGWATRTEDPLTLFLPRDSIEMEIVWRIVLLSYQHMTSRPARLRTQRKNSRMLPNYASAAKYWM